MENLTEIWLEHPNYPGYDISNLGRVRSWWKTGYSGGYNPDAKMMVLGLNGYGYPHVRLKHLNGKYRGVLVHHLVADLFLPEKPEPQNNERIVIDHIDGDKTNVHFQNLRWITQSQNLQRSQAFKDRAHENVPLDVLLRLWQLVCEGKAWTRIHREDFPQWTYYKTQHWITKIRRLMEPFPLISIQEMQEIITILHGSRVRNFRPIGEERADLVDNQVG
jgi:hypothetical protein